ncbi:MAG: hypothetical protein K2H23_07575 [Oscillospiraceae bacterium]|nr:hypothetical protein [Oscillospiraceae bacterium]
MKKCEKILVTAFDGEENSSRIVCEKLKIECKKIILPNDKALSCEMLKNAVENGGFGYIFSLGQKPVIKNKITVEDTARCNEKIIKINAERISEIIIKAGYDCRISHNAGTSFCNNLYFFGLNYISENQLDAKMFFIYVPFEKNCDTDKIADVIDILIQKCCKYI